MDLRDLLLLSCVFHLTLLPHICHSTASATNLRELLLLSRVFHLTLLHYICHSTASAMDLREPFLLSGMFYLPLLSEIWQNLLLSKLSWEPAVFFLRLQGLPLRFKTQTKPIFCLNRSVQQKLSVGRFYLCVKVLQNTISTSFRFWTHSLMAICIESACHIH